MSDAGSNRKKQLSELLGAVERISEMIKTIIEQDDMQLPVSLKVPYRLQTDLQKICKLINAELNNGHLQRRFFISDDTMETYISIFNSLVIENKTQTEVNENLEYISNFLRNNINDCIDIKSKENLNGYINIVLTLRSKSNIRIRAYGGGDVGNLHCCFEITEENT
jgi:hypothetical protein